MSNELKNRIRAEVQRLLEANGDVAGFDDSGELFGSGRLSSFAMMTLVMFLEQQFDIDFGSIDFDVSLVDTVNAIEALVVEQKGG